jgi:urease accessory protein
MSARFRLFQLASPALPIGGYSYSQGLEAAIESGIVSGEDSLLRWIADLLQFSMGSYEIPCLLEMSDVWESGDFPAIARLNDEFLASRESAELRAMSVQMGYSMAKLAQGLPDMPSWLTGTLASLDEPGLPCVWSGVACAWSLRSEDSAAAYLWSWAENQVLVAMKALPMGQSAGQRVLFKAGELIDRCKPARRAPSLRSNFAPALAILSAGHETQYSRLFRS